MRERWRQLKDAAFTRTGAIIVMFVFVLIIAVLAGIFGDVGIFRF